jgi:uncharacterized membrane protein
MPIPEFDARKTILPATLGILFLVVGLVVSNITYGIGTYVLNQINQSMGGGLRALVSADSIQITGVVFTILGVALLGVGIGTMIYYLIQPIIKGTEG